MKPHFATSGGGAMVWLTDHELRLLLDWGWLAQAFDERLLVNADERLKNKLEAVREDIARATPGNGR